MKPINEMTLLEVCTRLEEYAIMTEEYEFAELAHQITALTRWIPVGERLPTIEDATPSGWVQWLMGGEFIVCLFYDVPISRNPHLTHWRKIDKPEGV